MQSLKFKKIFKGDVDKVILNLVGMGEKNV